MPKNKEGYRVIKLLHKDAKVPSKQYNLDAGYDCYSIEDITVEPHSYKMFDLGFAIQIEPGEMLTIRSRSSTKKRGVSCAQTTCDAGYTGPLKGFLVNSSDEAVTFYKGERIVQLVFIKLSEDKTIQEGTLLQTDRGSKGFGSTGK